MNGVPRISWLAATLHVVFLRPLLRLICGVNIMGRENLEDLDQVIIIANHNSHLDILLLFHLLPVSRIRDTHPVADRPYFSRSRFVFRLVDFFLKPIWITRGSPDIEDDPMREIKSALDAGQNVIVFPEGTRGTPGDLQHFKSGIGRLMILCPDVPIVPVFLTGPERALPKASSLLLPLWNNLVVGPPQKSVGKHREITRHLETVLTDLGRSATASRHKRRGQAKYRPGHVAVLGIDGSGKSTVSAILAARMSDSARVCLISDEMRIYEGGQARDLQPLPSEKLRRRIGAYAKTASSLKHYKIPKLAELLLRDLLLREARRWYTPRLIVMDGSPLLNLLAWSVLYKGDEIDNATCSTAIGVLTNARRDLDSRDPIFKLFPELAQLRQLGLTRLSLPDAVILIDIDAVVASQRIESRGQQRQVHETEEKLDRLRRAYLRVCDVVLTDWQVPVLILDGTRTLEDIESEVLPFVREKLKLES